MPASVQEGSLSSTTSPPFIVCRLFDKGHSYRCELMCDCSFDFHFCKISWFWNPFKKKQKTVWVKLNSRVWLFDSLLCFEFFSRTFVEDRCLFLAFPQGWWRGSAHVKERKEKSLSRVRLFATLWTVAYQAFPSMGFSKQEYWSGLPFPSSGDLPDAGIEFGSPTMEADALNLWAPRE